MRPVSLLAVLTVACGTTASQAHYHMLLPSLPSAKKGDKVGVLLQFGHPFESQRFAMSRPDKVVLISPGGETTEVTAQLKRMALDGEKGKVDAFHLDFTPSERGDHVIVLTSAPTYLPEDKEWIQDTVKVIVHVQTQKGWDNGGSADFEWTPLTRPYGLLPGTIFQAQIDVVVQAKPTPLRGAVVEVERFNRLVPRALPDDEFITRTVKTDRNGTVTTTLPEAGWWCLTVTRPGGKQMKVNGKVVPVRQRSTLWVHVEKSAPVKAAE